MRKLWQEYLKSTDSCERKNALVVLMEIVTDENETLCNEALELALENGHADADSIRKCYYIIAYNANVVY